MAGADRGSLRPETLTVSHGYDPAQGMGAAKPPIFLTSTYVYPSAQHAKDTHEAYFEGTGPLAGAETPTYIYSRLSHPNLDMVEKRLAALDGAEDAAVFCSGMATHTSIALSYLRPGDTALHSRPIYGGTDGLLNTVMADFGVAAFSFTDGADEANIRAAAEAALAKGPLTLIVIETPANPTAAIVDIALVSKIAAEIGVRQGRKPILVVDNTLLGPFMQAPLTEGADLCMTSLTKYCGGHSDLLAGGVSGRKDLIAPLKMLRTSLGNHLDPYTSWLVLRSLETVHLRTERACQNAAILAAFLRDHPKVEGVTYLGFLANGSAARAVYDRQCRGAGSTFSFHLKGGEAEAFRMLDRLKLLRLAVSLGGSETLICHSATTTHYAVAAELRAAGGILPGTMRLSVGIEHVDDLIEDLTQALEAV
jgi:cystathionine gamma-synthase/methionine-gamma-lyase